VPRKELRLEQQVRDYLEERHKVLSLSGPTKSGKTVLVKQVAPDALWISGGDVSNATDFWKVLVDRLDGWVEITKQRSKSAGESSTTSLDGEINVVVAKGGGGVTTEISELDERVHSVRRDRPAQQVAGDLLRAATPAVVIDDFHYLAQSDQQKIVRGLRSLVFDGLPVILLSVPHRTYDAVRAEPEMTGRVVPLQIPFWEDDDLSSIAHQGLQALNLEAAGEDVERLVNESFGSPFLMQDFCLAVCKDNDVRETLPERNSLVFYNWDPFFRSRADATAKMTFERLARGPRAKERKPRKLKDGRVVDIYGLVLAAIAHTGPKTTLRDTELMTSIKEIIDGDPPAIHEVTRILDKMTTIAQQAKGEPVVDYMSEDRELHIADPFFAYYLRWGSSPS
jgi:hypothetical protein